ncbi:MAG: hypothetical protein AB7P21_26060 [Lautropia sp.]
MRNATNATIRETPNAVGRASGVATALAIALAVVCPGAGAASTGTEGTGKAMPSTLGERLGGTYVQGHGGGLDESKVPTGDDAISNSAPVDPPADLYRGPSGHGNWRPPGDEAGGASAGAPGARVDPGAAPTAPTTPAVPRDDRRPPAAGATR